MCNCTTAQISVLTGSKGDPGSVPGVVTTGGAGGAVTLTTAQSGMTFVFDSSTATPVTLPTASVGLTYDFVSTVAPGTTHTITAPGAVYTGAIESIVSTNAALIYAPNGTTNNVFTMNATTQGGQPGTAFSMTCYVANKWVVTGKTIGSLAPMVTNFSG